MVVKISPKIDVFVIDPPWPHTAGGTKKARPCAHDKEWAYPVMEIPEIFSLLSEKVLCRASENHTVFMWCIERALLDMEAAMAELGYRRHVRMVWDKGTGLSPAFTVQYSHEYLVWYYKGKFQPVNPNYRGSFKSCFRSPVRQHSRKPDFAYMMLDAMFLGKTKMDVFAREKRNGWLAWGNEINKFGG